MLKLVTVCFSEHNRFRVDWETHQFVVPQKEIKAAADIANIWEKSEVYALDVVGT